MTRFQLHLANWQNCQACELCDQRRNMVFSRGRVPCDILFIGEAPGLSEDVVGRPFVGPAGKLMDRIITEALTGYEHMSYALTNLVCCFPKKQKEAGDNEPPPESIEACSKRLEEFVNLAEPRMIVCVGGLAQAWIIGTKGRRHILTGYQGKLIAITHPAAILRMLLAQRPLVTRRCVVTIAEAIEEL